MGGAGYKVRTMKQKELLSVEHLSFGRQWLGKSRGLCHPAPQLRLACNSVLLGTKPL